MTIKKHNNNYYHTAGVTDLQAMKDNAQFKLSKGIESIVHTHKFNEPCMGNCIGYHLPTEDKP